MAKTAKRAPARRPSAARMTASSLVVDKSQARHDFSSRRPSRPASRSSAPEFQVAAGAFARTCAISYVPHQKWRSLGRAFTSEPYAPAGQFSHAESGHAKLLLHRREIDRFMGPYASRAYSIVRSRFISRAAAAKVRDRPAKGKEDVRTSATHSAQECPP